MTEQPDPSAGAAALLEQGRSADRAGDGAAAQAAFDASVRRAESEGDRAVLAEALRQLGLLQHKRGDSAAGRALVRRSYDTAMSVGAREPAAHALNVLAGIAFETGELGSARRIFREALALAAGVEALRARIEQNLGIIATVQGDHDEALAHYGRSLAAYRALGDERGCALARHNLGRIHADRKLWDDADACFREAFAGAERAGDAHLQGLCLLNRAEVQLARGDAPAARAGVERALGIFDRLEAERDKADTYRMLGLVSRALGDPESAGRELERARGLAARLGAVLCEAEATRELALLYRERGRNMDALGALNASYRLFRQLDARMELTDVGAKIADLEGTYLRVVHEWGQSLESSDAYTHGHCERVAGYGLAVGRALGLEPEALTALRLGAYLHDLGKVRVPDAVLNKPGKLTDEEFALVRMHPVWGLEMLAEVDFPWDIKPIIRWHHEKHDGSGYPDGLRGDEIPVAAQIICIVDVYDALTTTRSYKPAMTPVRALARMAEVPHWWRRDVYQAFLEVVGRPMLGSAAA